MDSKDAPKMPEGMEKDSKAYQDYYNWYCSYYQTQCGESGTEGDANKDVTKESNVEQNEFDNWAYYNYYYGHLKEGEEGENTEESEKKDENKEGDVKEGGGKDDKKAQKRKVEKEPRKICLFSYKSELHISITTLYFNCLHL